MGSSQHTIHGALKIRNNRYTVFYFLCLWRIRRGLST